LKIVGYIRVSSEGQVRDGYGLAVQAKAIKSWCKAKGHRLVGIREDAGVSGANGIDDREGLPEALEDIRDGRAEAMCVARLDRLARSLTVQEAILAKVWQLGGTLIAVDMGGEIPRDDPDDPMRTAMRQVAGVFAELDKRLTVKRLRDGRRAKRERGGYAEGGVPLGYVAVDGELGPDRLQQETLKRIIELRGEGLSWRQIVAVLTEEGHRTKRGKTWHPATVQRAYDQHKAR
jgi:DNA invertase Pin-like site-specific DNA recombinase